MNPPGCGGRRAFLVLDEGELEGTSATGLRLKMRKAERKDSWMPFFSRCLLGLG